MRASATDLDVSHQNLESILVIWATVRMKVMLYGIIIFAILPGPKPETKFLNTCTCLHLFRQAKGQVFVTKRSSHSSAESWFPHVRKGLNWKMADIWVSTDCNKIQLTKFCISSNTCFQFISQISFKKDWVLNQLENNFKIF